MKVFVNITGRTFSLEHEWYAVIGAACIDSNTRKYSNKRLCEDAARRWFKKYMPGVEVSFE